MTIIIDCNGPTSNALCEHNKHCGSINFEGGGFNWRQSFVQWAMPSKISITVI